LKCIEIELTIQNCCAVITNPNEHVLNTHMQLYTGVTVRIHSTLSMGCLLFNRIVRISDLLFGPVAY